MLLHRRRCMSFARIIVSAPFSTQPWTIHHSIPSQSRYLPCCGYWVALPPPKQASFPSLLHLSPFHLINPRFKTALDPHLDVSCFMDSWRCVDGSLFWRLAVGFWVDSISSLVFWVGNVLWFSSILENWGMGGWRLEVGRWIGLWEGWWMGLYEREEEVWGVEVE